MASRHRKAKNAKSSRLRIKVQPYSKNNAEPHYQRGPQVTKAFRQGRRGYQSQNREQNPGTRGSEKISTSNRFEPLGILQTKEKGIPKLTEKRK